MVNIIVQPKEKIVFGLTQEDINTYHKKKSHWQNK